MQTLSWPKSYNYPGLRNSIHAVSSMAHQDNGWKNNQLKVCIYIYLSPSSHETSTVSFYRYVSVALLRPHKSHQGESEQDCRRYSDTNERELDLSDSIRTQNSNKLANRIF